MLNFAILLCKIRLWKLFLYCDFNTVSRPGFKKYVNICWEEKNLKVILDEPADSATQEAQDSQEV